MLRPLRAVAYKELLHSFRDRDTLKQILVMQAVQLVMLGFIDLSMKNLPVVVIDQDRTAYSRELIQKVNATTTLRVEFVTDNIEVGRSLVRDGRARMAVVVPPDFHEKSAKRSGASVLTLLDGTDSAVTGQALLAMQGLASRVNNDDDGVPTSEITTGPALTVRSFILFNPQGKSSYYLLPGLLVVALSTYTIMAAQSLLKERLGGTMDRLLMTPLTATGLVLGKVAPYAAIAFLNFLLLLVTMRWGFNVPIRGSTLLLVGATGLYTITLVCVGAYVGSTSASFGSLSLKLSMLGMSDIFFSGFYFPLSSLPVPMLAIAYVLPSTHMIQIIRGVSLRDARAGDLAVDLIYFVVATFVFSFIAIRTFKRSTTHK